MINGLIAIWSGEIADIPSGWHLCDGTDDTPDLRDQFVVGAGERFVPGETGGAETHTHPFEGDGHNHILLPGEHIAAGTGFQDVTSIEPAVGTTYAASSLPAYFALAYIMKL
ncbi:hypothetical protein ES703_56346 [subsurface metagenome]